MSPDNNLANVTITEEEKRKYLIQLQEETTRAMAPAMTYLLLVAFIGMAGNCLVLIVYRRNFKKSPSRILIMVIAVFDLLTNVFAIPGEIYDMMHRWDFDKPVACGFRIMLNAFTIVASALALVVIAAIRYRHICRPHSTQVSIKGSKILSGIITIAAIICAAPCAILNGSQTKQTPRPGITSRACSIDDRYHRTVWPRLYMGIFIVGFLGCCITLIVLYSFIGRQAWRHSKGNRVTAGSISTGNCASESMYTKHPDWFSRKSLGRKISNVFNFKRSEGSISLNAKTECTENKESYETQTEWKTDNSRENFTSEAEAVEATNVDSVIKIETQPQNVGVTNHIRADELNQHPANLINENGVMMTNPHNAEVSNSTLNSDKHDPQTISTHSAKVTNSTLITVHFGGIEENDVKLVSDCHRIIKNAIHQNKVNIVDEYADHTQESDNQPTSRGRCGYADEETQSKDEHTGLDKSIPLTIFQQGIPTNDEDITRSHEMDTRESHDSCSESDNTVDKSQVKGSGNDIREELSNPQKHRKDSYGVPSRTRGRNDRPMTRTTVMLIAISAVYILAFLPHLSLIFYRYSSSRTLRGLTYSQFAAYNLFLRFHFLNSAANAIIYSLCDKKFREHAWKILRNKGR